MEELLKRRKLVKTRATRLATFAATVNKDDVSVPDIQSRLERLDESFTDYRDLQDVIELLSTSEDDVTSQEEDRQQFESKYYSTRTIFINLLNALTGQISNDLNISMNQTMDNAPSAGPSHAVKLPKLSLSTFSGDYHDWISFHDLFSGTINENSSLNNAQKLQYLKGTLKGEALRCIQNLAISDANYSKAWNLLVHRYQNRRLIARSHLRRLTDQPAVQNGTAANLRKLIDTTNQSLQALKALDLPTDYWDALIIHLVSQKLDQISKHEWELSLKSPDFPSLQTFISFIELRCQALDGIRVESPKIKDRTLVARPNNYSRASVHSATTADKCVLCQSVHPVYRCVKFRNWHPPKRLAVAKSKGLCLNCLRTGHRAISCPSRGCFKCDQRHHTSLHLEPRSKTLSTGDSSQDAGEQAATNVSSHLAHKKTPATILLATAKAFALDAYGCWQVVRALLDSGSQASFITESCVQRLKLKRNHSSIIISGVGAGNMQKSRGVVKLLISSPKMQEFRLQLEALVLPRITSLLPQQPIDSHTLAHIKDLDLADPEYFRPGSIDILFGADVFSQLFLSDAVNMGNPAAQNTVFGWVLSGKMPTSDEVSLVSLHSYADVGDILKKFWEIEESPNRPLRSPEEMLCEEHFAATHARDSSGRYIVQLPFRKDQHPLGDSFDIATQRLRQVEKRLERQPQRKQQYIDFMREYIEMGHMEAESLLYTAISQYIGGVEFFLSIHLWIPPVYSGWAAGFRRAIYPITRSTQFYCLNLVI